jgi:hypothetical protein
VWLHTDDLFVPVRQPGAQQKGEKLIASAERTAKGFRLKEVGNLLLRGFESLPVAIGRFEHPVVRGKADLRRLGCRPEFTRRAQIYVV